MLKNKYGKLHIKIFIQAKNFYKKMGGILLHTGEDNPEKSIPQLLFAYNL